jgi:peptidoglycan hydrolase-like protein with peptidoglycan-binding domain
MRRRRFLLGVAGLALVGAVPGALALRGGDDHRAAAEGTPDAHASGRSTAKVAKRDLAERADVAGTLGYSDSRALSLGGHGTVTALPAVGTVVDRGGQLAEVDGKSVLLLFGDRPLWRALAEGVDDGPDVEQLEANLIALGYSTESRLGPNEKWTAATTTAVKAWQKALGIEQTGTIEPGQVLFQPGPLRVAQHLVEVGGQAAAPVLQVTGTTQSVRVNLVAKKQALVHQGDAVQVVLPSGSAVAGSITSVGTVAEAAQGGQGDPTIPVVVALTDPAAAGGLDQAPVTVKITITSASGVLAVPVQALLALAEGGYAVERVTGTTTELVGVTLGAAADGFVAITGAIAAGDEVVTAK